MKLVLEDFKKLCQDAFHKYLDELNKLPEEEKTKEKAIELQEKFFLSVVRENDIVLPDPPQHSNEDIVHLIKRYCVDSYQNEYGGTVYRGGNVGAIICNNFNRPRVILPESAEFIFIDEFCNRYREMWVSKKDKVELTICEGDLFIVLYDSEDSLLDAIFRAAEDCGISINVGDFERSSQILSQKRQELANVK